MITMDDFCCQKFFFTVFYLIMQVDYYNQQIEKLNYFKQRVLESVDNRTFNQGSLHRIVQDVFEKKPVIIDYDDKELQQLQAGGYSEMTDDDSFRLLLSPKTMKKVSNKTLPDMREDKSLNIFGRFFGTMTHEIKHGLYDVFCGDKTDMLYRQCAKVVTEDVADKIIDDDMMPLLDKCTDGDYYKPKQISTAIGKIAKKYGQGENKFFQKVLYLLLLDDIKNEYEAYEEGFKAQKQILGTKGKFLDMSYEEAIEDNRLMREIAQEGYLDKFVPLKKLSRYI
ncbi:MAG: hypothetical protein PHE78_04245 [Candidatus Gastranaerophilales bacterium]|nr:hypothetical protein [Candidatus Gastranaerophilales bacterium]